MANKVPEETGKKNLILFFLLFPSFIIVVLGITIQNPFVFLAISVLVLFYQFVAIKRFVKNYYGE